MLLAQLSVSTKGKLEAKNGLPIKQENNNHQLFKNSKNTFIPLEGMGPSKRKKTQKLLSNRELGLNIYNTSGCKNHTQTRKTRISQNEKKKRISQNVVIRINVISLLYDELYHFSRQKQLEKFIPNIFLAI